MPHQQWVGGNTVWLARRVGPENVKSAGGTVVLIDHEIKAAASEIDSYQLPAELCRTRY
ncbi:MAG: hypothetical protein OXN17_04025 [Candidatus Poribacteria bacterium]|nr:hypothetical protein [Candidatus Poribacteria bacterium]MDE0503767.1 hypothetical protein [Candidatus Poribacteria bacterium]